MIYQLKKIKTLSLKKIKTLSFLICFIFPLSKGMNTMRNHSYFFFFYKLVLFGNYNLYFIFAQIIF